MNEPKTAREFGIIAGRSVGEEVDKLFRQAMLQAYRQGSEDYAQTVITPYHETPPSRDQMRNAFVKVRDSKQLTDF